MAAPRRRPRWDWRQSWCCAWFLDMCLVLGRFSCERGEQRVLVAAPRFALYVARAERHLDMYLMIV